MQEPSLGWSVAQDGTLLRIDLGDVRQITEMEADLILDEAERLMASQEVRLVTIVGLNLGRNPSPTLRRLVLSLTAMAIRRGKGWVLEDA
jgi:hypothetical protein